MMDSELPELLNLQEAAKALRVHPNTLRNWERNGRIRAVRIGSRGDRRFLKSSLWALLSNKKIFHRRKL